MLTECIATTSDEKADEPFYHYYCVTPFGDVRLPADRACCGKAGPVEPGETYDLSEVPGPICYWCDLILINAMPCVHSGLDKP